MYQYSILYTGISIIKITIYIIPFYYISYELISRTKLDLPFAVFPLLCTRLTSSNCRRSFAFSIFGLECFKLIFYRFSEILFMFVFTLQGYFKKIYWFTRFAVSEEYLLRKCLHRKMYLALILHENDLKHQIHVNFFK